MRVSLQGKLTGLLLGVLLLAAGAGAVLERLWNNPLLASASVGLLASLPLLWLSGRLLLPLKRLLRALLGMVENYRDGDFSASLVVARDDELGELMEAHNELGRALRQQRSHLAQRELLLDTITQYSPLALLLVDVHDRVAYANTAAAHLLNEGRSLVGLDFAGILQRCPETLRAAMTTSADSLFSVELNGSDEVFHCSRRSFGLQGRPHRLYLLKRMTRELSRQEVATWKKLIRVLSHELNNSLGPIASLAQSGSEVLRRGATAGLQDAFAAIAERAEHLHRFISGYAAFAKLPAPQPERVAWQPLLEEIRREYPCGIAGVLPARGGWFDRLQMTQVLINLLKNAHEAGGALEGIEIAVTQNASEQRIEVCDRGPGMTQTVMAQALLPFYSTKRSGSGLGLALAREIAEAHGGHILLANRAEGGLSATVVLPLPTGSPTADQAYGAG